MLLTAVVLPQLNLDPFPRTLHPYVGAVLFETFLYGLYMILFAICACVLLRRNTTLHLIVLAAVSTMFALATSDIIYTYHLLFGKLLQGGLTSSNLRPKCWLYVTNNVLAGGLLLYRCSIVWGFRKLILIGPVALLIAATVCGYMFLGANPAPFEKAWIYLLLTLILNVVLTVMNVGRIWWLVGRSKPILGGWLLRGYKGNVVALIESGAIYPLYIILDLAFRKHPVGSLILDAGLIQVVGIIPTLIIVQVGLGRAVQDIEANVAITHCESHKNCAMTIQADAGIHRGGTINIHCIHSQQHIHPSYAHMNLHPTVVDEDVAPNSSTDAIIAKEISHDKTDTPNRTDILDQSLVTEVPADATVEGDITGISLDSLCGSPLRMNRAVSLRWSWGEEMGISPKAGLGILQQIPKTM